MLNKKRLFNFWTERKKVIITGSVIILLLTIGSIILAVSLGKRVDDKKHEHFSSHISKLEIPNAKTRNNRILREFKDHNEILFFQGSASWNPVIFPLRNNTWMRQYSTMIKKPGVYEWSVSPPCHRKLFSIYRGYSANLTRRFKQYVHQDGIYPKGEELKTLFFRELADRGFSFHLRFRGTNRGSVFARQEEELGSQGGLKTVDYAFNHEKNGGYRQPLFFIDSKGEHFKLVKDFPFGMKDQDCKDLPLLF